MNAGPDAGHGPGHIGPDDFPVADPPSDDGATVTPLPTQRQRLHDMGAPVAADYEIPTPYSVTTTGVWKLNVKTNAKTGAVAETLELIASSPCLVVGVLRDEDGDELVELAWRHYGTWRRRAIPRAVVRSGRRLVTALGDAGFPAMDSTARKMETWLDQVEAANRNRLPVTTIARTLGWQPGGTFVTADGAPYPVHLRVTGMEPAVAAHRAAGALAEWQTVIKPLESYPIAQMGLYAAWAAPLLRTLGLDSFTVDVSGLTTTGKTTTLELALSVWADPHNGMAQWNATRVAIENRLAIVDGIVVAVDETSGAEKAETIRDLLYTVPRNRGRDRGSLDGSRPPLAFHTIMLTSGEQSILSFTRDGGTAARVLEITGSPFGPGGGEVARDLREGIYAHYGTAGPAFVARFTDALADTDARRNILLAHRNARVSLSTGTALNRRRAPLLAALWVAAHLACRWKVLPFDPPDAEAWRTIFDRPELADDRPGEALQVIRNWAAANQARLWGSTSVPRDRDGEFRVPPQGWAGTAEDDGGFALRPEIVREVLAKEGYELDAVKGAWAERNDIHPDGKNLCRRRSIDSAKTRLFVFIAEPDDPKDDAIGGVGP